MKHTARLPGLLPPPVAPLANASLTRVRQGRRADARARFERALALDARSREALAGLTSLDIAEGRAGAALKRVDDRLAEAGSEGWLHVLAGHVALAARDVAGAEKRFRAALQVDPSNLDAYGQLGQLYLSQGRLDQARTEFEALAARQPRSVAAQTMIGMILQMQGKSAEARRRYEQVVGLDPRAAVACNNLAWLYAEQGENLGMALQLARTAIAELPDRAEIRDTLGFVYLKRGQADLAVRPLREAVEADPGNPQYHYRLGLAYSGAGQPAEAKRALEKALAISPTFPGAADAKRALRELAG